MTVKFIVNHVGNLAEEVSDQALASTQEGYDLLDVMTGPRSTFWRSVLTANYKGVGYELDADYLPDHVVIARADKLISREGNRVRLSRYFGGGTWGSGTLTDLNPIEASDLMGVKGQDFCEAFSSTTIRGWGVHIAPITTVPEAAMFSKLYFGIGFDFGKDISPRVTQWVDMPKNERNFSFPLKGDLPYEIEAKIVLAHIDVSTAKIQEFLALPHIFDWPFFLYDPNQYVFPWKLEHVFVESYNLTHKNLDIWDVQLTLARLKHYE